jgi:dephospho-CoA kinase
MLQIGLTGGIGVGKTTVAKIFNVLGIPVFNADDEAKKLINSSTDLQQQIIATFGAASYIGNTLNRKYIADIVFNDSYKLELLNAIVHPATIQHYYNWVLQQKSPYVIKEAALMFEAGSATNLKYVIGVVAPKHLRYKRVMQRDNITKEQVDARMKNQIDDQIKTKLCDAVIVNDGQQLVITQVLQLHQQFISFS